MAAIVAACVVACSGEGEGQRCSTNDDQGGPGGNIAAAGSNANGTSDCSDGLLCYPAAKLGSAAAQYASGYDPSLGICCPVTRYAGDSVAICATTPSPPGGDAAPPADSGTSETGSESDAGDAAASSSADAQTDAQTDAAQADAAQADAQPDAETDGATIADAGPG
jgi:hypothetical protein